VNPDETSDEKTLKEDGSVDVDGSKAKAYQAIDKSQKLLAENQKLKGEFDQSLRNLKKKWEDTVGMVDESSDVEMQKLIVAEFQSITKDAERIEKSIREKASGGSEQPAYVQENRVPQDSETILAGGGYNRTSLRVKGAVVYRGSDGNYYHRDTLHTGEGAEIEVYNAQGQHIGTVHPVTGASVGGAVAGRVLRGL
jgi:hypothetical protein